MELLNLSKYKLPDKTGPAHRFQDLLLDAFKEFSVDSKGKGMAWGRIGIRKNKYTYPMIEQKIQFAINETRELNPRNAGRYFIKLLYKYL